MQIFIQLQFWKLNSIQGLFFRFGTLDSYHWIRVLFCDKNCRFEINAPHHIVQFFNPLTRVHSFQCSPLFSLLPPPEMPTVIYSLYLSRFLFLQLWRYGSTSISQKRIWKKQLLYHTCVLCIVHVYAVWLLLYG
jgi:hypothetical protein